MSKKDKKFIAALMFLQIGITVSAISLSGHYWHHSFVKLLKMQHLYEFSQFIKGENNEAQSNAKVKELKQHYQTKGIEAEEH